MFRASCFQLFCLCTLAFINVFFGFSSGISFFRGEELETGEVGIRLNMQKGRFHSGGGII